MELHDIRYLHDDSLPEDDELGGEFVLPKFLTKKNLLSIGVISVLVLSIGVVTFNISNRTTTQSSAQIEDDVDSLPEPTVPLVTVEGTVTCLPSETLQDSECDIAIQTLDGETYSLENVRYEDVASGVIIPGKSVTVTGSIVPVSPGSSSSSGSGGSAAVTGVLYLDNPGGGSSQPASSPTSTPTPTITLTPSPTPLPFSVPTPSVNYLSVKYIVDNKDLLVGKNVPLGAYIVSTQEPDPQCPQGEDCSRVQFIVNDATGSGRNLFYDTLLIANTTSEGEILFTPGQNLYATVTVVVTEGTVTLLLNILD